MRQVGPSQQRRKPKGLRNGSVSRRSSGDRPMPKSAAAGIDTGQVPRTVLPLLAAPYTDCLLAPLTRKRARA